MKKIIALLAVISLLICVCSCEKKDITDTPAPVETSEEVKDTVEPQQSKDTANEVETPYVTFKYPAEWVGNVNVTTAQEEESFRVIFKVIFGGKLVPLYDIIFGESEKGYLLGELPYNGDTIRVYCEDYITAGKEEVPEELIEDYVLMGEDLNVIISELVNKHGMR